MHGAVQLEHALGPGRLMQAVDVLGHDSGQLTRSLKLRELAMRLVGLRGQADHALAIEVVELLRVAHVEAVREHGLGRILELLMIEPVRTAEVGNPTCRRDARAPEEDHAPRGIDSLAELLRRLDRIGNRLPHVAPPLCNQGRVPWLYAPPCAAMGHALGCTLAVSA